MWGGAPAKSRDFGCVDDEDREKGWAGTTGDNTVSELNFDFDTCNEAEAESKGGIEAESPGEIERNMVTSVGPSLEEEKVGEEAVWKE